MKMVLLSVLVCVAVVMLGCLCVNGQGSIDVLITSTGTPTAGETFSLDCSVSGTNDTVTYQWFKGPASNGTQLVTVSQLEFSPLRASDAGLYTCQATVGGEMVEGRATVNINLPAPTAVTVTPPTGMIIAGSSPNLTCTVELSPAVDVPVTVTTEWSGPAGTTITPTSPVMESLTRYTIVAMVDAARDGNYTCQATLSSPFQFITDSGVTSGSTAITVAALPAPTITRITDPSPTSITLTWEQTEGAGAVDSYEIRYEYSVNECTGGTFPAITVPEINGSLRSYTLTNSSSTPVEEDSSFIITLTAVNSVGRSDPTSPFSITTADAAPGAPQSLRIASVDVTNITIQWDRVDCKERNGGIDSYVVFFYPTSNPSNKRARTISGTDESDRMFSLPGLPPQTSYTFEVEANNPTLRGVTGAIATINITTTAPQNVGFLLSGVLYPNNSVVTLADIGRRFFGQPLYCLTPSTECCSSSVSGEWYLPDGTPVASSTTPFSRSQVPSAVSLYNNGGTPPTGVFRCEIPDPSGTNQDIYVGIYPQGVGSPSITSVLFDRNSTTLTCTSTGGPPTTVSWRKDGVPVNESLYQQNQRLANAEEATYENTLSSNDIANFVGAFTCEVSNARDTDEDTTELNGVSIVRDQFNVGGDATARCSSDTPATRMEWLNNGVIVASDSSTRELVLTFSPVNDSIHNQVYICRVMREGNSSAEQNFTVRVEVSPDVLDASVDSSGTARAGMTYSLTCTVSKTVDGLNNTPTATWTTGGVAVSNGDGITVSTMVINETAISTLTFDPLKTSHDGRYSCDGTLTSPALDTPLMPFTVEELHVQISIPEVDIAVPSGALFAGSTTPLTLTCTISINPATDTDVSVTDMDIIWMNGTMPLSNSDARVTISPVSGSQPPFTSTLTLDPLSTFDNTSFTCRAGARPPANQQSFITASEVGEGMASVVVNSPSPPIVSIVHSSSTVMAGQFLSLTCSASIQEGVGGTPTLMWTKDGVEQSAGNSSDSYLSLSFSSLLISNGGAYTCTARLTIPQAGVDVSGTNTSNVFVQIPAPTVTVVSRQSSSGGQCGIATTLNCTTDQAYGFTTPPTFTWFAPDRSSVSSEGSANPQVDAQTRQLIFSDLAAARSGVYTCQIEVAIDNKAGTNVNINTNVPGVPQNLKCASSTSQPSQLTLSWDSPSTMEPDTITYIIDVKELRHRQGTREVIQSNIINLDTAMRSANIPGLAGEVPYNVIVKALNLAGCGKEQQIYCFTQEGEPPVPENVTIIDSNTTSITISWKKFTLVELKGLANYTISYGRSGAAKRQLISTIITVPWTVNSVTIHNLTSGVRYDITVSTSLRTGTSTPAQIRADTISVPIPDMNLVPVIIGVVMAVAVILVLILIVLACVCIVKKKRHSDELKLEKSRMLRAFNEPGIVLTSNERKSMDLEKEEEEITTSSELQEKPPLSSAAECELVQSPAHVPVTFAPAPKEPAIETAKPSDVVSNGDGPS